MSLVRLTSCIPWIIVAYLCLADCRIPIIVTQAEDSFAKWGQHEDQIIVQSFHTCCSIAFMQHDRRSDPASESSLALHRPRKAPLMEYFIFVHHSISLSLLSFLERLRPHAAAQATTLGFSSRTKDTILREKDLVL